MSEAYDLFQLLCVLSSDFCFDPPEVIFHSRFIGGCHVTTDYIVAMSSFENNNNNKNNLVRLQLQAVEEGVEFSISFVWILALAISEYSLAGNGTPILDATMSASQGSWMQRMPRLSILAMHWRCRFSSRYWA